MQSSMVLVEEVFMSTDADPRLSSWYSPQGKGQEFRVVAVDTENELIDLQNFDGEINEIDFDVWYEMDFELIAAPENWSGAHDYGEIDDLGTEITDTLPSDWSEPLRDMQPPVNVSLDESDVDDDEEGILEAIEFEEEL